MPTHKSVSQATIKDPADHSDDTLAAIVKRFWEIEVFTSSKPSLLPEDLRCEQLFTENCTRLGNGLHSVRLLSTSGFESLGDSYCLARRRFKSLEAKLDRNPALKAQYSAFLREYIDLGHMSLVTQEPSETQFLLPYHCVHKQESTSTKLRVVFDGSKTTSGSSLTDLLLAGPTIQQKIFNILLRFRFFKVALCGDICKMYSCVRVLYPDDFLQCIV